MSDQISDLKEKIQQLKAKKDNTSNPEVSRGYSIALVMMTDLLSCILVGL